MISSGYVNGWSEERTKNGYYPIQNKLVVDEDYFKRTMSAQQEAKEFFSEDESDSFNTNRMYTEGIEYTAQDYYDALDANGMYDLYESSVLTNLRARQ